MEVDDGASQLQLHDFHVGQIKSFDANLDIKLDVF
jgi:hypothetical protein